MRIMLDTNVLLSAIVFHSQTLWKMMEQITFSHQLVLSSYVIDECYEVVKRKKPALVSALDRFLRRYLLR